MDCSKIGERGRADSRWLSSEYLKKIISDRRFVTISDTPIIPWKKVQSMTSGRPRILMIRQGNQEKIYSGLEITSLEAF